MARFRDEWTDPVDGINGGQQWSPFSDNLSVYDANKIVNNLIHLKNRIVDGSGTILTLGGEKVTSMEVDSTPQESGTNRLVTSAGVANALKNFTPSDDNKYDDTELRGLIDGKVDKVTGKGLSTNDFTNEEKTKLAGLENYNDNALWLEVRTNAQDISNKASLDASNLSTSNVSSWKSKLGVPSSSVSPLDSYPVGSLYISTSSTSPASLFGGTWSQISAGYALWTATSGAGGTIAAGLPNITGSALVVSGNDATSSGAMSKSGQVDVGPTGTGNGWQQRTVNFNASSSNSIYGKSSTVQPPAYKVYAWKRTA